MKLYERLPRGVTVEGRFYKCDFDFRNVLKMLDLMQRDDIVPDARDFLCCKCLCKPPKNACELYKALCNLLFDKHPATGEKRLTSFEQDAGLIRAAFKQVYNIDLFHDRLSWFEFREYLQNLPEGNRYEDVVGIRAKPMPAPNKYNAKEREWLMKAKQSVALHLNENEAAKKYDEDVGKVFAGLLSMVPKQPQKEVITDGK